jgi:hypothetical protein
MTAEVVVRATTGVDRPLPLARRSSTAAGRTKRLGGAPCW